MVTAGVQAQHNSGDHNPSNKSNKSKTIRESAEWRHYLSLPLSLGDEEEEQVLLCLELFGIELPHGS